MRSRKSHPARPPGESAAPWPIGAGYASALDEAAIVAITDVEGRIIHCNDRFCQVSGYSRKELLGATHRRINSGRHPRAFFVAMYRALGRGQTWRGEICNRRKDGDLYWVDTTIVPQFGVDGRLSGYVSIRFDITAHVRALEELAEAQARAERLAATKDRTLANISHELRTPLTAVIGVADLLAATDLAPAQADYVRTIHDAAKTLHAIVDDVLVLAQAEADAIVLRPSQVSLRETLGRLVELLGVGAWAKGIDLILRIEPGGPDAVELDAVRLNQVLTALVGNAIKFTEEGEVRLTTTWRDGRLQFAVDDTGQGFGAAEKARLFRAFEQVPDGQRRHVQGAGLGLAIAHRLVEAMGGTLDAESTPGVGSRFWFSLPCRAVGAPGLEAADTAAADDGALVSRHVLVVEDNQMNQHIVRELLEAAGCAVEVAENGAVGLRRLKERPFDLCFMDLRMPVMDGWTATAAIRADPDPRVRATPVIALSADIVGGQAGRLADQGFDGFLPKPFDPAMLIAAALHGPAEQRASKLSQPEVLRDVPMEFGLDQSHTAAFSV